MHAIAGFTQVDLFHFSFCTESFDQVSSNLRPAGVLSKLFPSTECPGATHSIKDWDTFLKLKSQVFLYYILIHTNRRYKKKPEKREGRRETPHRRCALAERRESQFPRQQI